MKKTIQHPIPNALLEPLGQPILPASTCCAHRDAKRSLWKVMARLLMVFLLLGGSVAYADQDPVGCTGSGLGILLFTSASDVHVGDTLYYSVTVFNGTGTGPIVCDATGISAQIVTPDGVTHPITLTQTSLTNGQSTYYPDVVSYTVRAQDIQPNGTVLAEASDTGTIHQNVQDSTGGGNQGVNTIVSQPCINVTVHCTGGVGETGLINFSGVVTNCGNDILNNLTLTNYVNGQYIAVTITNSLSTNSSAAFSGSFVPANPCSSATIVLTAQASDTYTTVPRTVTASANSTCSDVLTPGILVTKSCPAVAPAPGQLFSYSGMVSNSGNVTLNGILVVDSQPAPNTVVYTASSLAPGAAAFYTVSYLAPTNCSVTETITASGTSTCGTGVTNSATSTCPILTTPALAVTENCPANPPAPGTLLTYSGTVTNVGNITINTVQVLNNLNGSTPIFIAASLAPGAGTNFTGSYIAPTNCSSTSILTASGTSVCGVATTNTATATCPVLTSPSLGLTQNCGGSVAPGGLLTYTGMVTNNGNITITNVTVVNSLSGQIYATNSLAPHTGASFTGSYIAPNSCTAVSTATATGTSTCGVTVSTNVTTTCPITTTPSVTIGQLCPGTPAVPGGTLTFTGTITNTGNILLTNVIVMNGTVGSTPLLGPITLSPGATAFFSGSYNAPTNCSSTSVSTVTATSLCGVPVSSSTSSTCPILTTPALNVTEACPTNLPAPGAVLTYSGTVTNVGNITLTNIVVLNSINGSTPIFKALNLPPGGGTNFTGSYIAPTNCASPSILTASAISTCGVTVTNYASANCSVITSPSLGLTQNCGGSVAPGGLLTYTGMVTNNGNITITNVTVVNSLSGQIYATNSLAPHTGASFTGSYIAPNSCTAVSTATATGTSTCGVTVSTNVTTTCPITTTPSVTIGQLCPGTPAVPGGTLTFTGTITNTGNILLTNVIVMNGTVGSTPLLGPITLSPGATAFFSGSYIAPTNCSSTSVSTVTATSLCGVPVSSSTSSTCPILTTPALNVTEACPTNPTAPGALLVYSGTVTNVGNITLTNVVVLNSINGSTPIFIATSLPPGGGTNFTGSYLTPTNCSSTSILTASAISSCGVTVTNYASATCTIITTPALQITQACPSTPATPGSFLSYTGTVTNTGNITITNITVYNNLSGGAITTISSLAPGTGTSFGGVYVAPDTCTATSISTVTGISSCGAYVTNAVTSTCTIQTAPSISISQNCPVTPTVPGGSLTFSGTITNTGNIPLNNIVILNNAVGSTPIYTTGTLAPGATAYYTGTYIAPTNCSSTSISTVTATSLCGVPVSSSASSTCPILTTPAIAVATFCPSTPVAPGSILTYSGSVTNIGNITLTNIIVISDHPTAGTTVFTAASLAPGQVTNFVGSYQVPSNCCVVYSSVTVSGQGCSAETVSNQFTSACIVATQPGIVVTKTCTAAGILSPGQLLTYSGTVSNSGNIALIDVTVTDNMSPGGPVSNPISLAPGQSVSFTGSYTVPTDFCGSDTLTATGVDICEYSTVANSTTTTCPITTTPAITVTKNCPAAPTPRGGLYTYTGTVVNSGNVSLVNVYVVDDEPTNNTPVIGPITLAPGASANFTNSYVAPTCCCLIIDTVTATGQDQCNGTNVSDSSTAVCPLLTTPSIGITENCPTGPIPMGSTFTFTGYVTNSGDVILTNVVVVGPLGTNNPVLGPIELAPHQAQTYTGTYTTVFNTSAITVTATGQETCGGTSASSSASCSVVPTPEITRVGGTNYITFPTASGQRYTVQYKNNLTDPTWTSLPSIIGTGSNATVADTTAGSAPSRFYRVEVGP